jgi:choline-sulfatase
VNYTQSWMAGDFHITHRRSASFVVLICTVLFSFLSGSAAPKPNIILVTIDSLRGDRVGLPGSKNPTPALDSVAKQSILFERAYAQAPSTVVSHASILSGTYPQTHHASELGSALPASLPYLPDLLHPRGYQTAAVIGSLVLDPRTGVTSGFSRGFETYDSGRTAGQTPAQICTQATEWLSRNLQAPFFLWLQIELPRTANPAAYDRAVTSADAALSQVISALLKRKLFDDSLLLVTASHGEGLGAHGEDTHGIFLYDETIHVPLLLKMPQNQMAGRRVKGTVRLVDIAPTVLEVAGVPVPSSMQGQSLLRIANNATDVGQPAYSRSDFPREAFGWSTLESWRAGKYLYIRAPKPELYDLSADLGAARNLAQSSKAVVDTMATQLAAFDAHFESSATQSASGLNSSEMQKLASLGYVGLQKSSSTATAAPTGTDPKDVIANADKTLAAVHAVEEGKRDSAVATLKQLLSAEPNSFLIQYALGTAIAQQQQSEEAIEHLHRAIELRPDSALAQYQMGLLLMKTGDFKAAAVHLEIASTHAPSSSAAHTALADTYDHLGRKQEASRERAKVGK